MHYRLLHPDALPPVRSTLHSAGADLHSLFDCTIPAFGKELIRTGVQIHLPNNYVGIVAGRSGLALNHHLSIGGGIIDQDYRAELCIILFNHGANPFVVQKGARVAQLLTVPITYCAFKPIPSYYIDPLSGVNQRGANGFGSTGE